MARADTTRTEIAITVGGGIRVDADVGRPKTPVGVVVFAHGSGSSRHSPRNREVATALHEAGLMTVLADLLTPAEEDVDVTSREHRFDIRLLSERVVGIVDWLGRRPQTARLPIGLFGASTGAAAALVAAAARPVRAVVSRGGRPDLAGSVLAAVEAPTLLIVGGADTQVLELNRTALAELGGTKKLEVVDGATHLFEEPGALVRVTGLARDWFAEHLAG